MNKDQMIEIARAGFPERIISMYNIEKMQYMCVGRVHRLYEGEKILIIPKKTFMAIHLDPEEENGLLVDIGTNNVKFNQYAAIQKMVKLGLIPPIEKK